jgi:signal transduction histidine kinase
MSQESVVDRLAGFPLFESVPRHDLEWLAEHGEVRTLETATVLSTIGVEVEEMQVLLEGRAALFVQKGGAMRKFVGAGAGMVIGMMPFSRFHESPGTVVVEERMTLFVLHKRHFDALVREHIELTTALVHHLLDRARNFRSAQLNDDRLQALSRLASGFAHELNNPASAATRTAQSLAGLLAEEEGAARKLAAARLTDEQLAAVDGIRNECGRGTRPRTALEAADREDEIADWLSRQGLDAKAAQALAVSDLTLPALDRLALAVPREVAGTVIQWVASGCAARIASRQIEVATGRIHELVNAVKGFTFMDREGVPEEVDVARGLVDTVAMLEGKARAKSIVVQLETAADLPRVHGFGSELNQVWEKLVDNAIDAVGERGAVTITAANRTDSVLVRVADDGPGISEEIRARIFDPFFTTKPVGKGTGLGLDMARRIVDLHRGDIDFSSQPGRTVFRVRLPAAGVKVTAGPGV